MPTNKNVYEIDAATVDSTGLVIPRDLPDEVDAYELPSRSVKSDWAVKIVNDGDASVDATPLVTTSDDEALQEYDQDSTAVTVSTGSAPENVELVDSDTVAGYLGLELVADPAPTAGTVTVVFNSRLYGGA